MGVEDLLVPLAPTEFLGKEVQLVNLVRMVGKETPAQEESVVKVVRLVLRALLGKKAKKERTANQAQMGFLGLQERGVPLVSVDPPEVMAFQVKRVLLENVVALVALAQEVKPVIPDEMAVLVFQECEV